MATRYGTIRRTNAAESIRLRLLELIEADELAVGDKLPAETELARAFGVSRPVVREALEALRAAGIVRSRSGYGSFVASRRPDGLLLLRSYPFESLHEVRCNLEIPGAGLAALRRLPEHVDELRTLIEELEAESAARAWVALDADLHVCLARATGNPVQVRLVEDFRDLLIEQSLIAAGIPERIARANREHRAIYDAVAASNAGDARRAMKRHLGSVEQSLRKIL